MSESEEAQLKSKIDVLQTAYGFLFIASLVALGVRWFVPALRNDASFVVWALLLGGAVAVRLYRNSLVRKYNASKGGPIS